MIAIIFKGVRLLHKGPKQFFAPLPSHRIYYYIVKVGKRIAHMNNSPYLEDYVISSPLWHVEKG